VARRSPTNARYQKYTEPKGQTRKSAAAAKPVRKEGGAASAKAKTKPKSSSPAPGSKYYEPDTPEYKFWRRAWWWLLGVGMAFVALSFFLQFYLKGFGDLRTAGIVAVTVSYAAIIAAFLIDYRKLRPMRAGTYVSKKGEKADKSGDSPGTGGGTDANAGDTDDADDES
jgi:hypothetical protein